MNEIMFIIMELFIVIIIIMLLLLGYFEIEMNIWILMIQEQYFELKWNNSNNNGASHVIEE